MPASEARIIANRQNAARSTGPKTTEGKERSRRNGLKHGLTGAGVVVAEEDSAEVERRAEAFRAELSPRSSVGQFLVRRMATLSVRMERSAKQESLAIARRVRHAAEDFDQERLDEAERLFEVLGEEPRVHLRKLRRSPEGVERLIEAWNELRVDLTRTPRPTWTAWHRERAENLAGVRIDDAGGSEIHAISNAIWGDFAAPGDEDGGDLDADVLKARGHARMVERIDAEIAGLEAHYETLDFETIDLDRAEAPGRALFDPSREATLARRYESEASRLFFKSLQELRQVEAEAAERPEVAPTPPPATNSDPLASSWDRPAPTPRAPQPMPERSTMVADEADFEPDGRPGPRGRAVAGSA